MTFLLSDRVQETANNPGQGDFELLGAAAGALGFVDAIGNGNTTRYIAVASEGVEIGEAEVVAGTPDRLIRPGTVDLNTNGGSSPINFTGTVRIFSGPSVLDILWRDEDDDFPARGSWRDMGTAADPWRRAYAEDFRGDSDGPAVASQGIDASQVKLGVITPAELDADQNNYNPTGFANAGIVALTSDATRTLTGLAAQPAGSERTLVNVGATNAIILSDGNTGSTAANRFQIGGTLRLAPRDAVRLIYQGSRWRLAGATRSRILRQRITSSGTYTPTPGCIGFWFRLQAGGAGAQGGPSTAGNLRAGAGGGEGGAVEGFVSGPAASYDVVIGAGSAGTTGGVPSRGGISRLRPTGGSAIATANGGAVGGRTNDGSAFAAVQGGYQDSAGNAHGNPWTLIRGEQGGAALRLNATNGLAGKGGGAGGGRARATGGPQFLGAGQGSDALANSGGGGGGNLSVNGDANTRGGSGADGFFEVVEVLA